VLPDDLRDVPEDRRVVPEDLRDVPEAFRDVPDDLPDDPLARDDERDEADDERDDDERDVLRDVERRRRGLAFGLRSLAGISERMTSPTSDGIWRSMNFCIRSSWRRKSFAIFTVSLSPSFSANASIVL
jgi:hypothetical protein